MYKHHSYVAIFKDLLNYTLSLDLPKGRALHAHLIKTGHSSSNSYVTNALIHLYAKCSLPSEAHSVFAEADCKDIIAWNSLITSYIQLGTPRFSSIAMGLFYQMRAKNILPNPHTFAGIFTAAANIRDSVNAGGREAHSVAIKAGCLCDMVVQNALMNMYCKSSQVCDGRKVFDRMSERNSVPWATMISGYAMNRMASDALGLFKLLMKCELAWVNEFVLTSVLSALTLPELVHVGRQVHGVSSKYGFIPYAPVRNALLTMYCKCGSMDDAFRMFGVSKDRNSVTWSAMVTGFAQSGNSKKALEVFTRMHLEGVQPTEYTFVGVIGACGDERTAEEGKQVHSYSIKMGFQNQMYVAAALVDMYAKCGTIESARKGFNCLQERDIVLWTSMIGAYVTNSEYESALSLYVRLKEEGISPNEHTLASILKACSNLAALEQGKQIHGHSIKYGFSSKVHIGSALSTMYAKCGCHDDCNLIFQKMFTRDSVSWNAMISGLAQNGHSSKAVELFEQMITEGMLPDEITFVNLLSACSHMGLVERARHYFRIMSSKFGITPTLDHYACMVDVLSRAGKLREAKEFIESVKIDQGMYLWRILLSACRNHKDHELGAYAGEKLMELGSLESSAYVTLSSIYAAMGKKTEVERIMKLMKLRGVWKEPGCSWIELKNLVHVFVVGDEMHPQMEEMYELLRLLTKQMIEEGYRPAFSLLLSNLQAKSDLHTDEDPEMLVLSENYIG